MCLPVIKKMLIGIFMMVILLVFIMLKSCNTTQKAVPFEWSPLKKPALWKYQ